MFKWKSSGGARRQQYGRSRTNIAKTGTAFWTTTQVDAGCAGICATPPALLNDITKSGCQEVVFLPHFLPASKSTAFFFFSRFRRRYPTPANPRVHVVNPSNATEAPRAIALNEYEFWSKMFWSPSVTSVSAKFFIGVYELQKTKDYKITHLRRNYFRNDTFVGHLMQTRGLSIALLLLTLLLKTLSSISVTT